MPLQDQIDCYVARTRKNSGLTPKEEEEVENRCGPDGAVDG